MIRKGRSVRVLTIIALVVAISGLTIAYAAISDSFKDKEDSSIWNIQFHDLKTEKSGSAEFRVPVISETAMQNLTVELKKPGDAVHLSFNVSNKGSLDALLSNIIRYQTSCKVEGEASSDICSKIQYTLQYEEGDSLAQNDLLNHKSEKTVQFSVVYPTNAGELVSGKVVIKDIGLVLIYKQNV